MPSRECFSRSIGKKSWTSCPWMLSRAGQYSDSAQSSRRDNGYQEADARETLTCTSSCGLRFARVHWSSNGTNHKDHHNPEKERPSNPGENSHRHIAWGAWLDGHLWSSTFWTYRRSLMDLIRAAAAENHVAHLWYRSKFPGELGIRHRQIVDTLNEADDCWNECPKEQQVHEAKKDLAEVELVGAKAAQQNCENRGGTSVGAGGAATGLRALRCSAFGATERCLVNALAAPPAINMTGSQGADLDFGCARYRRLQNGWGPC
jgi:hypothetical protein